MGLAGASTEEITEDYMKTYDNYYHINKENDFEKYNEIVNVKLNEYLYFSGNSEEGSELSAVSYAEGCKEYLRFSGLTDAQIDAIIDDLCEE